MGIGWQQILIILVIIVVIFGAGKLPQIGEGMGRAIKNFKKSVKDVEDATDITPSADKDDVADRQVTRRPQIKAKATTTAKTKTKSKTTKG